ncbi:MAG: ABC transporter permease [Bacteroidota bacterium]
MLKNHLTIALRQLSRNKVFASLNILGLSLGMAMVILIALFIQHELSYDYWMEGQEEVYRVYRYSDESGQTVWTPGGLAQKMVDDYPEVAKATGYFPSGEQLVTIGDKNTYVEETAYVDSTFFEVLPLEFVLGDPKTALEQPNSMVISDRLAYRLFGEDNPLGKTLTYGGDSEFMISAVVKQSSQRSHITSDLFTRFTWYGSSWIGNNRATYTRLHPGSNPKELAAKVEKDVNQLIREQYLAQGYTPNESNFRKWALQPLSEVYLYSENWMGMGGAIGSIRNIYIFAFIALMVLIVAIINYINLTTARASQRSKEVGVKKVSGAGRRLLTTQFIVESLLQAMIAGLFALLIAEISLPFFNQIIDRELALIMGTPGWIIFGTLFLAIITGLLAGSYPAFVMSAYQPAIALKSNFLKTGNKGMFRKILVTSQFAVSITLLIVMAFIYRQVNYMLNQDLGFEADQVIVVPMNDGQSHYRVDQLKSQFQQIPGVAEVTTASTLPGYFLPDWTMLIEGQAESVTPWVICTDADFDQTLDLELLEGRFLEHHIASDSVNNFIVNEEFVSRYGLEEPIGHKIKWSNDTTYGQIVGIVKNFHYRGLANQINPLVISGIHWRNMAALKLSTKDLPQTIASVENLWAEIEPRHPMRYTFLDEDFANQYTEQQRFGEAILYSTLLTIFIALLGLFGLTAFSVERRTREIGIRKVLGASIAGIIALLAQDFMRLLAFAFLIASPVAYLLSSHWLEDFAHRTDLAWWVFAGAGLSIFFIGFLTVCLQSVKAALVNPIESLRTE